MREHNQLVRAAAASAALFLATVSAGYAQALPPGGPGGSTPGTSSTVSPSTVEPCGQVNYTLTGFPAGETVNVKIDNGALSSGDASIQGQGVVARQAIRADGSVSGSVDIPCDFPEGQHTLRFLATQLKGTSGGSIGFTNLSPAFTVAKSKSAASGGDSGRTGTSDGGTSNGGNSGNGGTGGNSGNNGDATGNSDNSGAGNNGNDGAAAARAPQRNQTQSGAGANGAAQVTVTHRRAAARPAGGAGAVDNSAEPGVAADGSADTVIIQSPDQATGGSAAAANDQAGTVKTTAAAAASGAQKSGGAAGVLSGGSAKGSGSNGSSGSTAQTGGSTGSGNGPVALQTSNQLRGVNTSSAAASQAPVIGMMVAGAILLVGFAGVGAYLWVNRRGRGQ